MPNRRRRPETLYSRMSPGSRFPRETWMAKQIVHGFLLAAEDGYRHVAVERILTAAQLKEMQQGGRMTDLQVRHLAAFLLGAAELPSDATDPEIVPCWLVESDAAEADANIAAATSAGASGGLMTTH